MYKAGLRQQERYQTFATKIAEGSLYGGPGPDVVPPTAGFENLTMYVAARYDPAANYTGAFALQFGIDGVIDTTAAAYEYFVETLTNTTPSVSSGSGIPVQAPITRFATAGLMLNLKIEMYNYLDTTTYKNILVTAIDPNNLVIAMTRGFWKRTNPITRIRLWTPSDNQLDVNSSYRLYGE